MAAMNNFIKKIFKVLLWRPKRFAEWLTIDRFVILYLVLLLVFVLVPIVFKYLSK